MNMIETLQYNLYKMHVATSLLKVNILEIPVQIFAENGHAMKSLKFPSQIFTKCILQHLCWKRIFLKFPRTCYLRTWVSYKILVLWFALGLPFWKGNFHQDRKSINARLPPLISAFPPGRHEFTKIALYTNGCRMHISATSWRYFCWKISPSCKNIWQFCRKIDDSGKNCHLGHLP